LNLNLTESGFHMSNKASAWLGCLMTLSGCVGSVVIGAVMGRFLGTFKTVILAFAGLSCLGFAVFSIIISGREFAQFSQTQLQFMVQFAGIMGGFGFNCILPLFFELTLETVFGFAKASAAASMLIFTEAVVQISFLAVPTKIGGSAVWMNWLMLSAMSFSFLVMVFFRPRYSRLELDQGRDVATGCDRFGCI